MKNKNIQVQFFWIKNDFLNLMDKYRPIFIINCLYIGVYNVSSKSFF